MGPRPGGDASRAFRGDGGQVVPLFAVILVALVVMAGLVVMVGTATSDRARASAVADAAALAGARDGRRGAELVTAANGGRMTGYRSSADVVEVEVEVAGRRASARARWQW